MAHTRRVSSVWNPLSSRNFMMAGKTGSVAAVASIVSTASAKIFQ